MKNFKQDHFSEKTIFTNVAVSWKLKFMFYFMEMSHEPMHSDKWSLLWLKTADIRKSFIWIVILFHDAFKYDSGEKFWGYVGTNTKTVCVEFYNLFQCYILVDYLTSAINEKKVGGFVLSRISWWCDDSLVLWDFNNKEHIIIIITISLTFKKCKQLCFV
jgi:hypothetical protein